MNAFTKMRKKRGYSQESVAAAIGVERSTIAKWETGIAKPRIDNLLALSELYKCSVNELLPLRKGKNPRSRTRRRQYEGQGR